MHLFEGIWHIPENYKESLLCQAATDCVTAAHFPSAFLLSNPEQHQLKNDSHLEVPATEMKPLPKYFAFPLRSLL